MVTEFAVVLADADAGNDGELGIARILRNALRFSEQATAKADMLTLLPRVANRRVAAIGVEFADERRVSEHGEKSVLATIIGKAQASESGESHAWCKARKKYKVRP